jgi:hypothetical protein
MEHAMKSHDTVPARRQREDESLDGRYGKIGISAVVAALPYQSDAKNPAYAPVAPRDDQRRAELEAA